MYYHPNPSHSRCFVCFATNYEEEKKKKLPRDSTPPSDTSTADGQPRPNFREPPTRKKTGRGNKQKWAERPGPSARLLSLPHPQRPRSANIHTSGAVGRRAEGKKSRDSQKKEPQPVAANFSTRQNEITQERPAPPPRQKAAPTSFGRARAI